MITGREALTQVRVHMGNPPPSKINDGAILLIMQQKVEHYLIRANLTGENFVVEHVDLTVQPNKEIFENNKSPNFSQPFMVETFDPTDQNHVRREIKIARIQDMDLFSAMSNSAAGSSGYKHVAEVISFYKEAGANKVRVRPPHSLAAQYRVWFVPGRSVPLRLSANIDFLDTFNSVYIYDTALQGLAYCDWPEPRHTRIENQLTRSLSSLLDTFEIYRLSSFGEDTSDKRIPWGASREEDWE